MSGSNEISAPVLVFLNVYALKDGQDFSISPKYSQVIVKHLLLITPAEMQI